MSDNPIFTYTRSQAIEDGVFIDVSSQAQEVGFNVPVAITTNLFHENIKSNESSAGNNEAETAHNLTVLLQTVKHSIVTNSDPDEHFFTMHFLSNNKQVEVWAVIEQEAPDNPNLAINIMLPEDY